MGFTDDNAVIMQFHRYCKLLTIDYQRKKYSFSRSSLLNADHPRLVREQAAVYWAVTNWGRNEYLCRKRAIDMTISYNWLCDYLPVQLEPERLSTILTSIGLEVESLEKYESVRGGLAGLVIGEVLTTAPHPNADKLKLTTVSLGGPETFSIVCGASNVAAGQKVVVALPGVTIYPVKGEPMTLKTAKIRGVESQGMICAEDEIGLGESHEGIMVLPDGASPGTPAADWFHPYTDHLISIGLTPNHMDAMSHWGVARDVCAWLSHHENREYGPGILRQPTARCRKVIAWCPWRSGISRAADDTPGSPSAASLSKTPRNGCKTG
jgi:tRNA-binding EMAP/Myf-like protein